VLGLFVVDHGIGQYERIMVGEVGEGLPVGEAFRAAVTPMGP